MLATVLVITILVMVALAFVGKVVLEFVREFGSKPSGDLPLDEAWRIHEIYTAAREKMIRESGWYHSDRTE